MSGTGTPIPSLLPAVVATKGDAAANCYATIQEADDYLNMQYGAAEWSSLSADDKTRLLVSATKVIERMPIKYNKLADTQALSLPVYNTGTYSAIEGDGFINAKEACILQAYFLFGNSDAIFEAINMGIQGIKSEGLSSISKSVTGYNPFRKYHPDVLKIMSPFTDFAMKINRYDSTAKSNYRPIVQEREV